MNEYENIRGVLGKLGPGQLELVGPGAQLSGVPKTDMRNENIILKEDLRI